MKIENYKLIGINVVQIPCPKNTTPFAPGYPDSIVNHFTAGSSGASSAKYLARNSVMASAHLVIDRSGTIYQLVPFDTIAWHAGESYFKNRSNWNNYSIGIEYDNAGNLEKVGVSKYESWFGRQYKEYEVFKDDTDQAWAPYTKDQINVGIEVSKILADNYPIKHMVGHSDISPGRKIDPGPAFPLEIITENIPL